MGKVAFIKLVFLPPTLLNYDDKHST